MKIKVLSREAIKKLYLENPYIVHEYKIISINDPWGVTICDNVNIQDYSHWLPEHPNVLSLEFHDIEQHNNAFPDMVLFNDDHAVKVINFLKGLTHKDDLILHCFMGVSRSGSISTFAREMFNIDYDEFKSMNPQIVPNVHVLSKLTNKYIELHGEPHINFQV